MWCANIVSRTLMLEQPMKIELSLLDEDQFGFKAARAVDVTAESLPEVMSFCQHHAVQFLIARTDVSELKAAQAMERQGFLLMDTLVYAGRDIVSRPIPADDSEKVRIRSFRPGEEEQIRIIAVEAFHNYGGHYHADERLDRKKCDAVYESWAIRSCFSREMAEAVLVAEQNNMIAGFTTLKLNQAGEGDIRLFAVAPWAQRQGIARSLMIGSMNWCREKGLSRTVISTQITNYAMRKVWTRLGFEPTRAFYTFHRWFD